MIQQYLGISPDKLIKAGWETLYMVGFSLIIGSIVGFFIAIVLWLTRKGGLKENPLLYTILNDFINIIRSTPFIILLVCVMPFTKIIVGTRIGTRAAIVPLVIYTAPFLARLLETSLLEVGGGIIQNGYFGAVMNGVQRGFGGRKDGSRNGRNRGNRDQVTLLGFVEIFGISGMLLYIEIDFAVI